MTDVRPTLHMPYSREPDARQPEPTPVVLAADPSAAGPAPEPQPQAAETLAQIVTSDAPDSSEHSGEHSGAHSDAHVIHQEDQTPLLWSDDEARKMSQRWEHIEDEFVDKPRKAVEEANSLVAAVATRLTEMFDEERARLEGQWDGGEVSAEDLHIALQRYRAFFRRSLAI